jgi:hypothetical protein
MALFHKARRTRSSTRLVCRADGASIALIPRAGLTRRQTYFGGLFRCVWRSVVRWRKFHICELFTL